MARYSNLLAWVVWPLALATVSCNPIDVIRAHRTARDGNSLYRNNDYRGAIEKYREALAIDPNTPNAHLNLGYSLYSIYNSASTNPVEKNAARDAVVELGEHIQRYPKDERAKNFRIKTLLRAAPEDPELAKQAYTLFTDLLKQNPKDVEVKHFLVTLLTDTKGYQQALDYFGPQVKEDPNDLDTMKALAIVADKSDRYEEAAYWYRTRAEHAPDDAARAVMFYELGTYAWNALHYHPDVAFGLTAIHLADEGIAACRKAMTLKSEYAEAMAYANLLYLKRQIYESSPEAKDIDEMLAQDLRNAATKIFDARKAANPEADSQK